MPDGAGRGRKFRERNLVIVAAIAAVVLIIAGGFALNFAKLTQTTYSADLQSAVGLQPGDVVTIAGVRVGSVSSLSLDGSVAKATFAISRGHRLGDQTSVVVKVLNPVGVEYLELVPNGSGTLHGTIPVDRTSVPGTLVGDLNQLTNQTQQTNLAQLVKALQVLTSTVAANSPEQTKAALDGVANLSAVLAGDQQQLEAVITQGDPGAQQQQRPAGPADRPVLAPAASAQPTQGGPGPLAGDHHAAHGPGRPHHQR
jgi:phospholipid/cholesterol/gamma-HCH transport system substrate-binding protein